MDRDEKELAKYVGRRLRTIREANAESQEQFAERLGISQGQLSKLETGERRTPGILIHRLALRLQLPPASFFPAADDTDMLDDEPELIEAWRSRDYAKLLELVTLHLRDDERVPKSRRPESRHAKSE